MLMVHDCFGLYVPTFLLSTLRGRKYSSSMQPDTSKSHISVMEYSTTSIPGTFLNQRSEGFRKVSLTSILSQADVRLMPEGALTSYID